MVQDNMDIRPVLTVPATLVAVAEIRSVSDFVVDSDSSVLTTVLVKLSW